MFIKILPPQLKNEICEFYIVLRVPLYVFTIKNVLQGICQRSRIILKQKTHLRVEDENHFLLACLFYSDLRYKWKSWWYFRNLLFTPFYVAKNIYFTTKKIRCRRSLFKSAKLCNCFTSQAIWVHSLNFFDTIIVLIERGFALEVMNRYVTSICVF